MKKIINAKDEAKIKHDRKSKNDCYAWVENSFLVMPDQKTIIGVKYNNYKNILIIEEMKSKNKSSSFPKIFGVHNNIINTILYNKDLNVLIVGDKNKRVVQYSLNSQNICNPKMIKDYGDIGVGPVIASAQYGHLVAFGGYGESLFTIINIKTCLLYTSPSPRD